jgi:hypothetical protein
VPWAQFITCTWMSPHAAPALRPPATSIEATSAHQRERLTAPSCGSEYLGLLPFSPLAIRRGKSRAAHPRPVAHADVDVGNAVGSSKILA